MRNYLIIACLIFPFLASCSQKQDYIKTEGMIWNTVYHITFKGPEELKDSILPVLNEVDNSLSIFNEKSLVSRLNNSYQAEYDEHLKTVYDMSKRIHTLSDGRFDPTVAPLVDAWGFGRGHKITKDTLKIDSILEFVGLGKTKRDGNLIIKEDIRTCFNFSAIAKGYGCDAVGKMFQRNGVTDYMIEIGGEVLLSGLSQSGEKWKIGIDTPEEGNNPGEKTVLILSITDAGIATSGNYRNYRKEGDKIIAHTISPKTGYPYVSDILSATIIAPSCMEADAIATACLASTPQEAKEFITASGVEGLLIFSDMKIWCSPGFDEYIYAE